MGALDGQVPGAFESSRLEVRWQRRAPNFLENLRVVVWGPRDVWGLRTAESFFRLRIPPARRRGWQLAGSLVCHVFLLTAALATSRIAPAPLPAQLPLPEVHITWYGPARDVVPKIAPRPKQPQRKAQARREQRQRQVVTRGYNPHTTVVFHPPHATNRRQLLIEPQAPPQLPKFLPAMQNIIRWEASAVTPPAITIHPNQLRAVRGKGLEQARLRRPRIAYQTPQGSADILRSPNPSMAPPAFLPPRAAHGARAASRGEAAAAAPELARVAPADGHSAFAAGKGDAPAPPLPGALGAIRATRAASRYAVAQGSPLIGTPSMGASTLDLAGATSGAGPVAPLPSAPNAVRARRSKGSGSSAAAPSIGLPAGSLVSLSLSPGAAPPPPGNAYAPMSIGPHPGRKGLPAGANLADSGGSGKGPRFPAPENSATGPEGLLILHDADSPAPPPMPQPRASARPKRARASTEAVAATVPRRSPPAPGRANAKASGGVSHMLTGPISVAHNVLLVGVVLQNMANKTIGPWSMPTLPMNLPRLSNTRGTWVLDFAKPMPLALREQNNVIVPLPASGVEPQYPVALRQEGVRGKVVLFAVIKSNGRVSQVRVMQSLNPVLDQKAEAAFSRWRFEPALLNDKPIAMPVIVTVPFHYIPAPH